MSIFIPVLAQSLFYLSSWHISLLEEVEKSTSFIYPRGPAQPPSACGLFLHSWLWATSCQPALKTTGDCEHCVSLSSFVLQRTISEACTREPEAAASKKNENSVDVLTCILEIRWREEKWEQSCWLLVISCEWDILIDGSKIGISQDHLAQISLPMRKLRPAAAKSLQSCPTLCDPIDGSPPGSPIPGILQARTLEWVAISFSNTWKWKVKVKSLSHVWLLATPWTAAYQAPPSMGFSRQEYWSGVPLPSPNWGLESLNSSPGSIHFNSLCAWCTWLYIVIIFTVSLRINML